MLVRPLTRLGASLLLACLVAAGAAPAALAGPSARGALPQRPPLQLPGDGARAAAAGTPTWIVAGRPGPVTHRVARRHGAVPIMPPAGIFRIDSDRARSFAADLRRAGQLAFAEADVPARTQAFPSDPLTPDQWWLPAVVDLERTPPPVTPESPLIGVVDGAPDLSHPELSEGNVQATQTPPIEDAHGTAVIGTISAPANGVGITGLWPGARVLAAPALDESLGDACSSAVAAVNAAVGAGVSVINMSYGFDIPSCYSHLVATQYAFGAGVVPVAAGGNEFQEGNTAIRPAVDPHVVTVAAVDRDFSSANFSSENDAIDLSAPGVDVLTSVPTAFDADGDGYDALNGTSFSSPIVAAAAAWVRAERPELLNDQVAGVLRNSASELGDPGWEQRFGYGLLNLDAALAEPAPAHDVLEPNDDIEWVSGRRFPSADPPIFRPPLRSRTLRGTLDKLEDPADVYRVVLPGRSRTVFRVRPRFGDPDVEIYRSSARTVQSDRGLIARSQRNGGRVDSFMITNRRRGSTAAFLDVYIHPRAGSLDAGYTLTIKRR